MRIPLISDAKASHTRPWPGSFLAISNVAPAIARRSMLKSRSAFVPLAPSATNNGFSGTGMGSPFASRPAVRYGNTSSPVSP